MKEIKKLHQSATYLGAFPYEVASELIERFSNAGDLVVDNFSGKGTTALAARVLKRKFIGNDLNPYAYVLSKWKCAHLDKAKLIAIVSSLEQRFFSSASSWQIDWDNYRDLMVYYSPVVLEQLIFLRQQIGISWSQNSDYLNGLLTIVLSLMYGPARKDGTTRYFSLSMPSSISMSVNYVRNYAKKHNLVRPEHKSIFNLIREQIEFKWSQILETPFDGQIYYHNSLNEFEFIKDNSTTLVVTSPPYLNLVNYASNNWLRLWMLGYDKANLKDHIKLSDNLKLAQWQEFIFAYLSNIYSKIKPGGTLCLIVGTVYGSPIIEQFWNEWQHKLPQWEFVELISQNVSDNSKTLRSAGTKAGRATKVEQVLILKKNI